MIFPELQYDFPQGVYLIFLLFLFLVLLWKLKSYREQVIQKYVGTGIFSSLIVYPSKLNRGIKYGAFFFVWIFAVLAFMQPKGNPRYAEERRDVSKKEDATQKAVLHQKSHEVTFLLDASLSMAVKDAYQMQSRLEYSKDVIDEAISQLKGEMAALSQFTDQYVSLSPPTFDYLFVRMMLQGITIQESNGLSTDIIEAITHLNERYAEEPPSLYKTLVIFSDGDEDLNKQRENELVNSLEKDKAIQLKVLTVGVGSKKGGIIPDFSYEGRQINSSLKPQILELLARVGNGEYINSENLPVLILSKKITDFINSRSYVTKESEKTLTIPLRPWDLLFDYYFQIPLGISIALLCLILTIPESKKRET